MPSEGQSILRDPVYDECCERKYLTIWPFFSIYEDINVSLFVIPGLPRTRYGGIQCSYGFPLEFTPYLIRSGMTLSVVINDVVYILKTCG